MARTTLRHLTITELELIGDIVSEIKQGHYQATIADIARLIAIVSKLADIELIPVGSASGKAGAA